MKHHQLSLPLQRRLWVVPQARAARPFYPQLQISSVSPACPLGARIRERHRLVVEQNARDCPGHRLSKRDVARQANRPMCWASKSAVRWRSRMLTVSQLSRQAKENPVRGADFERGKFAGGRGPSTHSAHARRRAEGYYHRLPLIICPEPDSEWMMNLVIFCPWNSRVVSPVRPSSFPIPVRRN
jgi:hypothetical protein